MSERRNQMKLKKDLQTKVQKEIEEEGNKAGPNAKKYNF